MAQTDLGKWEKAALDDIPIRCRSIGDGFPRAVAVHEMPGRDTPVLRYFGKNARTVNLRCYFSGKAEYINHLKILELLDGKELFALTHPAYGTLWGEIPNVQVRHDEAILYAEIDLEFVEGTRDVGEPAVGDVKGVTEGAYEEGMDEAAGAFSRTVRDALGDQAPAVLGKILDPGAGILEQFTDVGSAAREYVKKVDVFVSVMEAALSHIATPANALASVITFGADLPGRVLGAVARTAARYTKLYEDLRNAPDRFVRSFQGGILALEDALDLDDDDAGGAGLKGAYRTVTAMEAGKELGALFSEDEEARNRVRALEETRSFDVDGTFLNPERPEAVMNVREIETALYLSREMVQQALDAARDIRPLNNMALVLLRHAVNVKLESLKIVRKTLDHVTPLHLVCLHNGLPYQMAERILKINNVKNPSFCTGTVSIYS